MPAPFSATITEMSELAEQMASTCAAVITTRDVWLAVELENADDGMDELHRRLYRQLVEQQDTAGPAPILTTMHLTLCGRYYARYADLAVSAARRLVYLSPAKTPSPRSSAARARPRGFPAAANHRNPPQPDPVRPRLEERTCSTPGGCFSGRSHPGRWRLRLAAPMDADVVALGLLGVLAAMFALDVIRQLRPRQTSAVPPALRTPAGLPAPAPDQEQC